MTEYETTKEQCEAGISGVCPGCGGEVVAIETVDNSNAPTFWSGCNSCEVYTEGVPRDVFEMARTLVDEGTLVPYRYREWEERDLWLTGNTRQASRILMRVRFLAAPAIEARERERLTRDLRQRRAELAAEPEGRMTRDEIAEHVGLLNYLANLIDDLTPSGTEEGGDGD